MRLLNLSSAFISMLYFPAAIHGISILGSTSHPIVHTDMAPRAAPGAYNFHLYATHGCSGLEESYTGTGATGCLQSVGGVGAWGFVKVDVDPHCTVHLFSDRKCSKKRNFASIHSDTTNECSSVRRNRIKSFKVTCS